MWFKHAVGGRLELSGGVARFTESPDPSLHLRQYHYQATDESYEALRKLRGAWARMHVIDTAITVVLADETAVIIQVEAADIEDAFEAFRITAMHDPSPMVYGDPIEAYAAPGNDVVVFTGATWSEPNATLKDPLIKTAGVMHFSGHPGQLSDSAEIICLTSDALVVATAKGAGMLIRTGLKPYTLELVREPADVRKFLFDRGYASDDAV